MTTDTKRDKFRCSFCGNGSPNVQGLIVAEEASICAKCVFDLFEDTTNEGLTRQGYLVIALPRQAANESTSNGWTARRLLKAAFRAGIPRDASITDLFETIAAFLSKHLYSHSRRSEMLRNLDRWMELANQGTIPSNYIEQIRECRRNLEGMEPLLVVPSVEPVDVPVEG